MYETSFSFPEIYSHEASTLYWLCHEVAYVALYVGFLVYHRQHLSLPWNACTSGAEEMRSVDHCALSCVLQ